MRAWQAGSWYGASGNTGCKRFFRRLLSAVNLGAPACVFNKDRTISFSCLSTGPSRGVSRDFAARAQLSCVAWIAETPYLNRERLASGKRHTLNRERLASG